MPGTSRDPTVQLLARTRRRLARVTLGLVALLVVGIGAASAYVTLRALDADVDRALATSVEGAVAAIGDHLPSTGDNSDDDDDDDDSEEAVLASSNTFLLVLDPAGVVVANPSGLDLVGLPDDVAVTASRTTGRDLRTVKVGGVSIRLLTVPIVDRHDSGTTELIGFVQGGFVLTLHDAQSWSVVVAVTLVGLIGLAGAAVVTMIVTGRALVPIRESFAAQRRFVADASHELRTPTALIRANAEVMERESLVVDEGRPLVSDIVAEADRLTRLTGDLLALAAVSPEEVPLTLDRRPLDLAVLAADMVREATALARTRDIRLEPGPGVTAAARAIVEADHDRLVQLVLILLENAIDHSPTGGAVTIDVERDGPLVRLVVSDEGPGVPPADRDRIFEPFVRLPGVPRSRATGTGLGLAIARRIVSAHGWTIGVADTARGRGAVFIVTA